MKIDSLLDELAERIAERVLARINKTATKTVYTSSKLGPHVPGKSRDWMLRHLKTMPGATKSGRDWEIDAEDYDRWKRANDAAKLRKPLPPTGDDEALADAFLAKAGFRTTKRAA